MSTRSTSQYGVSGPTWSSRHSAAVRAPTPAGSRFWTTWMSVSSTCSSVAGSSYRLAISASVTGQKESLSSSSRAFDVPLDAASIHALDSRHRPKAVEPQLLQRIRGEFRGMRGFSPTLDQAARLFHLP